MLMGTELVSGLCLAVCLYQLDEAPFLRVQYVELDCSFFSPSVSLLKHRTLPGPGGFASALLPASAVAKREAPARTRG